MQASNTYSEFHCAVQTKKARTITILQRSAIASKNCYGCFWKSAVANAIHAKKQKILQKSGLHEALTKMLLNDHIVLAAMASWLQSDSRSKGVVDHVIRQAHAA